MPIVNRDDVSAREWAQWNREDENMKLQMAHAVKIKEMSLESEKIGSRWTVVFRLPLALIKLPISLMVCVGLVVYAIRGIEPPESLVQFIKV